MKYYIISPPKTNSNEIEIVNHLLKDHDITFHLRKPDYTENELKNYLRQINSDCHSKITIHNNHQLIHHFNLKGIHFTSYNRNDLHKYQTLKCCKSISTHSFNEIVESEFSYDYYFLSPIFESVSKPGYGGNSFNEENLKSFLDLYPNVVALGGVNSNNIKKVDQLGFYGAAILGTFWQYCDQIQNLDDLNLFFQKLNNAIAR